MTLTAAHVAEHFRAVGTWVDWSGRTCDGFKAGDPATPVTGIAVAWQSSQAALEEAQAQGCDLFITHEPTFYSHMDDDRAWQETLPAQRKRAWFERSGMVVYRCHDVWDVFPRLGIVDSWSEYLGLGEPVARAKYYNLHEVPATTVWELAQRLGTRLAPLGQQAVQLIGKKWQMVRRLAVGTGAITGVRQMVELGADVVLGTDDGITLWRDGAWMADLGLPLLIVNHMTAEIPGLRNLADYLRAQFPGVKVAFVGPTCSYEIYATERMRDTPIRMRRDDLEHLPPLALPEGYECRPMQADESWAYQEVMNLSNYYGDCDAAWFTRTFSQDPQYDPAFLQLIWKGERPVAAATAWHIEIEGERWGMIHWVGASNTERGKGLGKMATLAALHTLRARGFTHAMLDTAVWRLPAVAAYLGLGFRPWPTAQAPQAVWEQVLADLATWRGEKGGR
jgi:putative NIF3 family GTP cyclohydrolase 1 type 2